MGVTTGWARPTQVGRGWKRCGPVYRRADAAGEPDPGGARADLLQLLLDVERLRQRPARLLDRDHRLVEAALGDVGHDHDQPPRVRRQLAPGGLLAVERRADALVTSPVGLEQRLVQPAERRVVVRVAVEPRRQRRDVGRGGELVAQLARLGDRRVRRVQQVERLAVLGPPALGGRRRRSPVVTREELVERRRAQRAPGEGAQSSSRPAVRPARPGRARVALRHRVGQMSSGSRPRAGDRREQRSSAAASPCDAAELVGARRRSSSSRRVPSPAESA